MNKLPFKIILSILLLVVIGIFTFLYFSSTFNEQNLKAMDIRLITEAISKTNTRDYFLLSPEERAHFGEALDSVTKEDFKPQQITHQYKMVLHNSWGFSRGYTVIFTENAAVFLQDHQAKDRKSVV